ncbi:MAG: tRNA (guanosine(37)-N1)-methyltransferase TrmD [Actinobacteria bacterium]|nr:MAG: tRNA (guanosine(37)-N1)-methyltransferase TrmD [Actinomycetota bacterium]
MIIDIITAFPKMFLTPFDESIIKIAKEKNLLKICTHDLRDYSEDKHRKVDDYPYGGGPGMVLKPEPFFRAHKKILVTSHQPPATILLTPQGKPLKQSIVNKLAKEEHLILLCGHYEGVDERVRQELADEEISVGDYVLSGGEIPAMVLVDSITRKLSGVLGSQESLAEESFIEGLLEYPHYTRPAEYKGLNVPDVLLSGNHSEIKKWRKEQSLRRTKEKRPDLINKG